jgi:cytochrome c biogenesis protein CcmG/thiol:disulfide interchange protein DsbE
MRDRKEARSFDRRRATVMVSRAAAVGLIAALLGLLVWDLVDTSGGASFVTEIDKGKAPPAPELDLAVLWDRRENWPSAVRPRLDDGRLTLAELRGFPVVVNFWASWCIPCREEASAFNAVAARYAGRVVFVGVDTQDLKSAARRFLRHYKLDYVSVRDGTDQTYSAYGLTGVPETYFIDRRGHAVSHAVGAVARKDLEVAVAALVREPR